MPERFDNCAETLSEFRNRLSPARTVDRFDLLLEDLFLIRNPRFKFIKEYAAEYLTFETEYLKGRTLEEAGEWFYFPWNGTLAHYLPEEEHLEIRTARNRNIILPEEQRKLYDFRVAYAGLSVGSHGVTTFALMGGGKHVTIADPDVVSASNLNRVRYDYLSLGRKKTDLAREYIYQLNPYASVTCFDEGVTEASMDAFFAGVQVLVEETDNLEMKIRLRFEAKARRIPVIMATDNGDNIIFECERFDLNPDAKLFNGALGDITLHEFKSFEPSELPRLATKIAGPHLITERMMQSLQEVGKSIYSWPQLGDAATLSGVAIAFALKRLALGEPLRTEKSEINLDALLTPDYEANAPARELVRKRFLEALGL